jgi:two-component system, sensor histidine kinase and response regulator
MTPKTSIRILVIDDQQSIHDDFRKIIETQHDDQELSAAAAALFDEVEQSDQPEESFEINSAHQGQEGLAMVAQAVRESRPYPLAFVDVRMPPGWDGVETIERIWAVDPEILIVLCTAYSDHTWEDIVRQLGRTDHLLILKKPFDNIEVRQLVMSLTRRWHLARQADITRTELEQMVSERTADLAKRSQALEVASEELRGLNEQLDAARRTAEAANRAKSEFLANLSHEIRTPMTAILGFSDILAESVERPEQREAVQTIHRNGEYLLDLINDILDLSKIEAGKLQAERIPCAPTEVLADVVSLMRVRADAKGIALKMEFVGPVPEIILTDPTRLRQILVNLIGNAIKFTESGEVRIVTRLVDRDTTQPKIQCAVVDTGIGMTPEQMQNLFQPFRQADASTTRKFGGTGLGLNISKRLANLLGGDITVRSEAGQGSTFSATIDTGPLTDVALLDQVGETIAACPTTRFGAVKPSDPILLNCRILLAEDGPDNQRLIAHLLRKAGADLTVVENGQRAVDAVRAAQENSTPFDVILMDMQMPVMDGYQATHRLRAAGCTSPVIALTAHAMDIDRQKCVDAGCDDYATKPIQRQELFATVAQWAACAHTRLAQRIPDGIT